MIATLDKFCLHYKSNMYIAHCISFFLILHYVFQLQSAKHNTSRCTYLTEYSNILYQTSINIKANNLIAKAILPYVEYFILDSEYLLDIH